ncbi:MAG: OadG family protein [Chloroflexi bacterium]|nr:OadG family protein [Chloroflexota bacterium]
MFEDGLLVTGIGMGVVFGVLVLLMFAIQGLGLFDRAMQIRQTASAIPGAPAMTVTAPASDEQREATNRGEIVAAIAAALALAEEEQTRTRHDPLIHSQAGIPDGWAAAGRNRMMSNRGRPVR